MDCVDELDAVRAEKARAIETLSENLRVAYQNRDAAVKDVSTIIGDVEEIRHRYGAVSYTHLDVYKRQEHNNSISQFTSRNE